VNFNESAILRGIFASDAPTAAALTCVRVFIR
jgi:hypothetical protein